MKDIIAGHVSTAEVADDKSYLGRAFWDKTMSFLYRWGNREK